MITLSLCMIVKDEQAVLSRALSCMQGIADEIIVVDTGSSDQTPDIARQYTPHVFSFPWAQDFAAARNFACSKATMDYWMWLDADDVITPANQEKLRQMKHSLDPDTDIVMMKYLTGFDAQGNATFSYERERIIKNAPRFRWHGRVHEAIIPQGNIVHLDIAIEHRKVKPGSPDRNLHIYETMLANGETLEPRHQFYYARELYDHQRYPEAIRAFEHFLQQDGWVENRIDACLHLSRCHACLGHVEQSLLVLFRSFCFDVPRAEICCEIGAHWMEHQGYRQAIYWYQQALSAPRDETSGAFIQADCYDYIPFIQLCVCYDRLGEHATAFSYHQRAKAIKPQAEAVQLNTQYFQTLFASSKT